MNPQLTRVLVVDDSAYVRKVLSQMLGQSPLIEVVGAARDGAEALEMAEQLQPDVVTLDLVMPGMDGIGFLEAQMQRRPLPVVLVSISAESSALVLRALEIGAVDMIQKPTALATERIFEIREELIETVKRAAGARVRPISEPPRRTSPVETVAGRRTVDAVVIGLSTGGPQALRYLIPQFPASFPVPVAVVLHMPPGYTQLFAKSLNEVSPLQVVEASNGLRFEAGRVLLAPGGRHLKCRRLSNGDVISVLSDEPQDTLHRPSVDVLFQSAVETYSGRVLGAVLTGMGSDGLHGTSWIKAAGGTVLTESESTCVVYGMPRSVDEAGLSDRSVPLTGMADAIRGML